MYNTKLVHCCDVVPNLVVEIENFNFCLFVPYVLPISQKEKTCSDIRSVTWLRGKKFAHFRPLESGFLAFSHFI